MTGRVKRIFDNLEEDVDLIVLINHIDPLLDQAFFYVTGYETGLFEAGVAFLYPDGKCEAIVSKLEETSARKGNIPLNIPSSREEYEAMIEKGLKGADRIGLHYNELIHSRFKLLEKKAAPNSTFLDCTRAINKARAIKDKDEVERIRCACDISSRVASEIPSFLHDGVREYEVAAEMEYRMKKMGADCVSFSTISSFGKNTAEPHYNAGGLALEKNVFALFDYGATYKRYVSDITRTFFYGRASKEDREMYETVQDAQQIGFDAIEPGKKMCEPHDEVASFIDGTRFKGRFIHSLGHGIGLSVHESFIGFMPNMEDRIEPGMVITVEPGIYLPGHGGVRIEDDILVKKNGIEILTKADKDFLEV
ncbi:MAG TPA: Xaa-Pro peptidase family protein [Candidatus Methanofastidiosa archaeon]|nr:Xaa-Pro peptidase family protein [Candidatus Methanofastidiosa archaeon]